MREETIIELCKLRESIIENYGDEVGESAFEFLLSTNQLKVKTEMIVYELDNLLELYSNKIFDVAEKFYSKKYKANYNGNVIKLKDVVNKVIIYPLHKISDEVTLLFYVGLYHKIENYENEILEFYNRINQTKFKTLKSIGLDIPNKKKLFADRDRIRIICNSIKHNNFYPKNELLKFYPYLSIEQKLSLKDFNPKADIELIKIYIKYFNFIVIFKSLLSAKDNLKGYDINYLNKFEEYFETLTEDESIRDENQHLTYLRK